MRMAELEAWKPGRVPPGRLVGRCLTALAVVVLWAWAFVSFDQVRLDRRCRFDYYEAVAYPISDAGCDYLNALAIVAGDGWVNWRDTNRWTVYKPGWGAFLGVLAVLTRGDPARMQMLVTLILAGIPAVFFLTVRAMFPGRWSSLVAFLAAVTFLRFPFSGSWWFVRTMMTEGPTLMLLLLVSLLAVRGARRRIWRWGDGLAIGAAAGALSMVRSQGRYAVLAIAAVLLVAALRRFRARVVCLALVALGFAAVTGPNLIKTSIHLRQPYFGTSVLDLWAVLAWSPAGKAVGGEAIVPQSYASEGEALEEMWRLTRRAMRQNLEALPERLNDGAKMFRSYSFKVVARAAGKKVYDPVFLWLAVPAALAGLLLAWLRLGTAAWIPIFGSLGYIAPLVAISYSLQRFGEPVSWLGLFYIAGAIALLVDRPARRRTLRIARARWRLIRRRLDRSRTPTARRSARSMPELVRRKARPPAAVIVALSAWIVAATAGLLWFDLRPLVRPGASKLLGDPRTAALLESRGVELGAGLEREIDRALSDPGGSRRVISGVAHLPIVVTPERSRAKSVWFALEPAPEPYTAVMLATAWKGPSGRFGLVLVTLHGALYPGFRNGDHVVAVLEEGSGEPPSARLNHGPTFHARAIVPTRWSGR